MAKKKRLGKTKGQRALQEQIEHMGNESPHGPMIKRLLDEVEIEVFGRTLLGNKNEKENER